MLAKHATAKRMREKLDATLLNSFPGYAFIKGFAENLRQTEELAGSFLPVLVQFDDYVQIAFETYREPAGRVAVYLPGAKSMVRHDCLRLQRKSWASSNDAYRCAAQHSQLR